MREALLLLEEREQRSEVRRQELHHIYRPETRPSKSCALCTAHEISRTSCSINPLSFSH